MNLAIIGAGKWGQALFKALAKKNDCVISSRTVRNISGFVNLDVALNREFLIFAVATQSVREFLSANFKPKNQKILVVSKGVEIASGKFLHEIFGEFIDQNNLAFLSGPSFASEVAAKLPCALAISSVNSDLAQLWADAFPEFIKTYVTSDVIGSEICGAYKNVIAIAGGICDGLGLGNNARASLIARGLVEMHRFGKIFGAQDETFLGLSGAGDLFLTASSKISRNYRVGLELAKGEKIDNILQNLGETAEGVPTAKAISQIAAKRGIHAPIAREVAAMIDGKNAKESLRDLLKRK